MSKGGNVLVVMCIVVTLVVVVVMMIMANNRMVAELDQIEQLSRQQQPIAKTAGQAEKMHPKGEKKPYSRVQLKSPKDNSIQGTKQPDYSNTEDATRKIIYELPLDEPILIQ